MSKLEKFIDHINSHVLPFIDYDKLQASYNTDMAYAKGILSRLHDAMAASYGGEVLDKMDGDDGFVVIPGVLRGRNSGKLCIALFDLDLSSSGEHWGTTYLCEHGVVPQGDAKDDPTAKAMNAAHIPYDYCYTATIPCDIHVDKARLPEALKAVLNDFRNYSAELLPADEPRSSGRSADAGTIDGVTEVRITAQEFESRMRELIPGASDKAIKNLISYAEELHTNGVHPRGAFFSENYVDYNLAVRQHGREVTGEVLKICEESCLNSWEIRDAARLMAEGVSPGEILQKSIDGELDYLPGQLDEEREALAALQNGTLEVPAADEKASVLQHIRDAAKAPKEPRRDKPTKDKSGPEH